MSFGLRMQKIRGTLSENEMKRYPKILSGFAGDENRRRRVCSEIETLCGLMGGEGVCQGLFLCVIQNVLCVVRYNKVCVMPV